MILIYGKGKVGQAVADFCEYTGITYDVKDDADADLDLAKYDLVIPGPGIPPTNRCYTHPCIVSELDFAHRYLPPGWKIISITGTDGKSTTTWITYRLLCQEYGESSVELSGNFEIPFSETVKRIRESGKKRGIIVVEMSSFMAHNLSTESSLSGLEKLPKGTREGGYRSTHSIFTNLESDHLNWHENFEGYFADKFRMCELTTGTAFVNGQVAARLARDGIRFPDRKNVRLYGHAPLKDWTDGEDIAISGRRKYRLSETAFSGMHNAYNVLSASLVMNALGICSKRVREYLRTATGLPHRLETIETKLGRTFVDDSKSTSCQSLKAALSAYAPKSVVLIAGGSDKGDPFEWLGEALSHTVSFVVLIGKTAPQIAKICETNHVPYVIPTGGIDGIDPATGMLLDAMDLAVRTAFEASKDGQTILLSPGCASFGLFKDYLDRANRFRDAVRRLP